MISVEIARLEKIATVFLENPPVNSLNSGLMREMETVLNRLAKDDNVNFLIITGKGKFFSAGADINELKELSEKNLKARKNFCRNNNAVLDKIEKFPKPVIAAINGYALGGGCELSLACHFRFISKAAKIGLPEINLGIFPGWGGTWRLPKLIGSPKSLEVILTGKIFSAEEALEIGMVDLVTEPWLLIKEAEIFAKIIAEKPPDALAGALKCLSGRASRKVAAKVFAELLGRDCAKKGINNFLTKKGG